MMARLTCSRSGWGTVRDPETGERIPVDSDVSLEVAERLASEYGPIDFEQSEPEDPTCAGNDGGCSRSVDEPGTTCWQH